MKRITKYQKADKLATELARFIDYRQADGKYSPRYTKDLIRLAYMKGHKAGMARQKRINLNKEFYKRMRLINENIAKAMG